MVPFGIWGGNVELSESKRFFPPFYCSLAQSSLELGLQGKLDKLSAVLIPILCDTLKCLGQNWKIGVPQVPFIQVSHPQNLTIPAGVTYLSKVYRRVGDQLGAISGTAITPAALQASIAVVNGNRAALREFVKVAAEHPEIISPYDRHCVIKSGYFQEKSVHTALVRELTAELAKLPKVKWNGHKVVLSGIMADSPELLKTLEANQISVVADELAQESRQFLTDAPDEKDPYLSLALQFASMEGCSLIADPSKRRGKLLSEMARNSGAQGVIYVQTKFCDPDEFDYPVVKRDLEAAGVPVLNIEIDQQMQQYEQVRTAVQTFATMLD
jgi:benzoyl-CoA reductase/2-hydroxyglutaryl-CoA dehydratase subunit BcrC/BadD/HgdB